MTNLQFQIPKKVEDRLGNALLFCAWAAYRRQEHQIEITVGGHLAATRPAEARPAQAPRPTILDDPARDEVVDKPNELVMKESRRLRSRAAIAGLLRQALRDFGTAILERAAKDG